MDSGAQYAVGSLESGMPGFIYHLSLPSFKATHLIPQNEVLTNT